MVTSLLIAALELRVGVALGGLATHGRRGYGLMLSVPVRSFGDLRPALPDGVIVAVLPARRAGKLNVLAALSYE
jgi:hypothetical protein